MAPSFCVYVVISSGGGLLNWYDACQRKTDAQGLGNGGADAAIEVCGIVVELEVEGHDVGQRGPSLEGIHSVAAAGV